MRSLLALLLVPGLAIADPVEFKPYPGPRRSDTTAADAEQGAAKLTVAIRARDARAIQRLLATAVHFDGVWFADTACRKRFGRREVVTGNGGLAALAKCLAGVKLQLSTRKSSLEDGAVLTIDPGVEVELAFDGTRVRWLSFVGQAAGDAVLPTLTAQAFEALRTAGSTNLDAVLAKPLDATVAKSGPTSVWLRVCLDAKGAVTSATVRELVPALEPVKAAFVAAVHDWKFKPLTASGVPTAACSLSLLTYPAAKAPETETLPAPAGVPSKVIVRKVDDDHEVGEEAGVGGGTIGAPPPPPPPPPPPAPPQNVPPQLLESLRISGDKVIAPDDATQKQIKKSGKERIIGAYKMCLDVSGTVSLISQLKSTGYAAYDQKITKAMRTWRYKPYQINGKATPVCTAVTLIYSVK